MDKELVLERLLAAHEAWFTLQRDFEYAGRWFAGYGEFHSHGSQYVLVKRAKLWEVDVHELLFLDTVEHLDSAALDDLVSFMTHEAVQLVDAKANHMSTNLSLVVIADRVDDDAWRKVRKTRFRKNFKLGLRGWADLRLVVVDLSRGDGASRGAASKDAMSRDTASGDAAMAGTVTSNAAAADLRRTVERNMRPM